MGSMLARALRLLPVGLVLLAALFAPVLADEPSRETVTTQITQRLHRALDGALRKAVDRANKGDRLKLELKMSFVDESDRVFMNLGGVARFDLSRAPAAVQKKVRNAGGTVVYTNGSVAIDFCIRRVDEKAPGSFDLVFDSDIVILAQPFLRELTRFGVATLGVLSIHVVAGKVIEFFEGLDSVRLGEALAAGTKDVTKVLTGETAAGAYERTEYIGGLKFAFASGDVTVGRIAWCFGACILRSAAVAGFKFGGLTAGAAIGAALFPATGAAIGATIGGAATVILGAIVIQKATLDVPLRYRLWRIQRAREKGDEEKAEPFEEAIAAAVQKELAAQRFDTLDLLISSFEKRKPEELGAYQPLIKHLRDKLAFAILQKDDWSAARKWYQLLGSVGQLPDTSVK